MAKLYFYYSAMNAGKSTALLQSSFNYRERGMNTLLFTAAIDQRYGRGIISSRIGIEKNALMFDPDTDMFGSVATELEKAEVHCVLIDEAQFLSRAQVFALGRVADELSIPVLCYGLRTDFQAELFEGSMHLLALADELVELKTICPCGRKATMNLRIGEDGKAIKEGAQKVIGGNESYIALCRKHFYQRLAE
ncbi:MAG: thymidine kinase [Proteobacteria bacterium]|nr:thymidine kinase [Pseudomonadota bacterium]